MIPYYRFRSSIPHPGVGKGDKFIAIKDFEVTCLTHFAGPYTFGFDCVIPKGTILISFVNSEELSAGFGCLPEKPDEFEKYIPPDQKNDSKYQGFSIVLKYTDIGKLVNKII
jgi:hypothetical protein